LGARPTGTANAARVADLVAELAVPGLNPRSVAALGGAGTVRKLHQKAGALAAAMQEANARKCGGKWRQYDPKAVVTVDADAHKQGRFVCWVDDQGNQVAGGAGGGDDALRTVAVLALPCTNPNHALDATPGDMGCLVGYVVLACLGVAV
jgi:hypothetical protein